MQIIINNTQHEIIFLYRITNQVNNKVYIGQTNNPNVRWSAHKGEARNNPKYPLHHSFNKHGIDNFIFEIINSCLNREDADYIEEILIEQYNSRNNQFGYNIKSGGNSAGHSEETKQKISEDKTQFYQKRLAETGQKMTDEERQKLSDAQASSYANGRVSHRLGKTHTFESLQKMSQTHKGKPSAKKGKPTGKPAWNKGGSNHQEGSKRSEETKAKMRIAALLREQRKRELKS